MVAAFVLFLMLAQTGTATPPPADTKTIPEPKEIRLSPTWEGITGTFFEPLARMFDVPRHLRASVDKTKQAENITPLDEVQDSSWFTNRNFVNPLSPAALLRDVNGAKPPDAGPWTVTKCKTSGVSTGFQIRDAKGDTYILKFDPPQYAEMATAADVIGSRLLYAAGYNVPSNFIVEFDQSILKPQKDLMCTGPTGKKFPMTREALDHLLESVAFTKDHRVRAMASKFLDGKPKGPFSYIGVRSDDPNDQIPHEHHRELRGLYVIAAFINHVDLKQNNTLDMYVDEDGRKFLKHYFIDFGSTLGSGTLQPQEAYESNEYFFDTGEILKSAFTLGLHHRDDTRKVEIPYPSIGNISGKTFQPNHWKPHWPIPPFQNMTERDAFWGAKIVSSFTDDHIAAAVRAGQFSNPAAERALIEILKERRNRTVDYWFRRVAPLDRFRWDGQGLAFDDLAIRAARDHAEKRTSWSAERSRPRVSPRCSRSRASTRRC